MIVNSILLFSFFSRCFSSLDSRFVGPVLPGLVRYTQHTLPVFLLALLSSFSFRHRQDAYAFCAMLLRALTVALYKASLKANKKAAVMTLWVTLGPMPKGESLVSIRHVRKHILNLPP